MKAGLDIPNLDKWLKWLQTLEASEIEKMKSRMLRSLGMAGLSYTQDVTPRRSGRLQNSLTVGDRDNIFVIKVSKATSYVVFGTAITYAEVVETGITAAGAARNKGRFVPGFWQNGVFHYVPKYKVNGKSTGMVLTGKIVLGAHMFQKGIDRMTEDVDKIAEFEFRRLYAELM